MIIERFHEGKVKELMESKNKERLLEWIEHWKDLADFEIFPVINSQQAKEKVFNSLQ